MRANPSLVVICALLVAGSLGSPSHAANIAASGFNEDVVMEAGSTHFAHAFDAFNSCWVETGYGGATSGLPVSRQFVSATHSGVVYQLQPYNGNNVLRLGDDDPRNGTLVLAPGQYSSLHILSASGIGSGINDMGAFPPTNLDITLNFADGSVLLPGFLFTHDWTPSNTNAPGAIPPIALLIQDRGAMPIITGQPFPTSGTSAEIDHRTNPQFALYETTLDLTQAQVDYSQRILQSINFTDHGPATAGPIGVFAVDGTPVPEPSSVALLAGALCIGARRRQARHGYLDLVESGQRSA